MKKLFIALLGSYCLYNVSSSTPSTVQADESETEQHQEVLLEASPTLSMHKQPGHSVGIPTQGEPHPESKDLQGIVLKQEMVLYASPSETSSQITTLPRGTKVSIETRKGAYYRIASPSGARGWVKTDSLLFGRDAHSQPTKTVRIKGFQQDLE